MAATSPVVEHTPSRRRVAASVDKNKASNVRNLYSVPALFPPRLWLNPLLQTAHQKPPHPSFLRQAQSRPWLGSPGSYHSTFPLFSELGAVLEFLTNCAG
jgi:hypothetical protein